MPDLQSMLQRNAEIVIALVLATYAISFAAFYPQTITVRDEVNYLRQADWFAAGQTSVLKPNPLTGEQDTTRPGSYPVGTSLLMLPFVKLFGRPGAFAVPCLGLLFAVGLTAAWIRAERRSPLFALAILGFPAALVMGRVAMSDAVSLFPVTLGLWCFWRGMRRGSPPSYWLCAGFLAGSSICFRESNALIFAFFFVGALVRRDRHVWALIVSGLFGVAMRPLSSWVFFDTAFFVKQSHATFSLDAMLVSAPQYLVGLMIFIPAGLLAGLTYRGRRAPELRITVAAFVLFYLTYGYSGTQSGLFKSLVLGQRFFIPLLPLLAFALAEVVPRWWRGVAARWDQARAHSVAHSVANWALAVWLVGLIIVCAAVHPIFSILSRSQAQLAADIANHVEPSAVLVTNLSATEKLIRRADYAWKPLNRNKLSDEDAMTLLDRHQTFYLVLLDRDESEQWREDARKNAAFVNALGSRASLLLEDAVTRNENLRIWRVSRDAESDLRSEERHE